MTNTLTLLPDPDNADPQEFAFLARQMADTYRAMVTFYQREYGKSLPDAMAMAADSNAHGQAAAYLEGLRADPPDVVTWSGLRGLEDAREGDGLRKWEQVKAWARDELQSGQRGASAVENWNGIGGSPQERARFGALVAEMAKDWEPLSGMERLLVEQMAQAYTMQLYWTSLFGHYSVYRVGKVDREQARYELPRVSESQVVADAAAMVDRWNRMFLRCLRQLRDLRRYSAVVINNPTQVNLGQQQVNLASSGRAAKTRASAKRQRQPPKGTA